MKAPKIAAALLVPRVHAQPAKLPRVGVLLDAPSTNEWLGAFRDGLRELGYIEGQDLLLEVRAVPGPAERLVQLAAELVRLKVRVILAGGSGAAQAALKATHTIPVIFADIEKDSPQSAAALSVVLLVLSLLVLLALRRLGGRVAH